jgi:DNA-binding transcriptional ArsR family regulator
MSDSMLYHDIVHNMSVSQPTVAIHLKVTVNTNQYAVNTQWLVFNLYNFLLFDRLKYSQQYNGTA